MLIFTYFEHHIQLIVVPCILQQGHRHHVGESVRLAVQSLCSSSVRRHEVCQVALAFRNSSSHVPWGWRRVLHALFIESVFYLIGKFMKAPSPSRDRGEMAMAGLRLLLLLQCGLYIRCCPFPSCTVTVKLLAPRIVAGCFSMRLRESA